MKKRGILKKLTPRKIKTQLILGIALVHLVLMAVFVFDMMKREESFLRDQNHDQTVNLAKNLGVNVESYLIANDYYTLERIIRSYSDFPDLKYAMILSPEGVVLAHTDKKNVGTMVSDKWKFLGQATKESVTLGDDKNIYDLAIPILHGNEQIGWARLGVSQEYIYRNLETIRRNGIYYILIALGVGCVLAILMGNLLNRGLYKLIDAADEIRKGNRSRRIEEEGSFELAELGSALNHMLDEIGSNEKKLNLILDNLPVGVFILDADGSIISNNPAAKKLWEGVELVGPSEYALYKAFFVSTGLPVQREEWAASIALKEQRNVVDQEIEIDTFRNNRKSIINSAILLKDVNNKMVGVLCMNIDITERRNLERDREKMLKDLLQRNSELEQFSYIVSHNIRGPLATLLGLSDLLNSEISAVEKNKILRGMGEHAAKLDMVVKDLNEILSVKKEKNDLKVSVNLVELLENVKNDLQNLISSNKAIIQADFSEVHQIMGIKAYLHSVFLNLISNSIKYKMTGTDPLIEIRTEKKGNLVQIFFKDNGTGIDLKMYGDEIFGLYKRFNLTTEGKGMGLYMVKTQVNSMKGTIELASTPGQGSVFTVNLPLDLE